jgi:hypothetical protein
MVLRSGDEVEEVVVVFVMVWRELYGAKRSITMMMLLQSPKATANDAEPPPPNHQARSGRLTCFFDGGPPVKASKSAVRK